MRIKIKSGIGNFQFEHRRARYLLQCSPVELSPTLGEIVHHSARRRFVYGRVSLVALASRPLRIKKSYLLSRDFYDEAEYQVAVTNGFDVQRGGRTAARLLIKAGLAEVSAAAE
jgi:hypothetical protein